MHTQHTKYAHIFRMNQSNNFPNQQNSIPTETEIEPNVDSLKQALVEALKPYSAKEIKDNFDGFVPDKFVDGEYNDLVCNLCQPLSHSLL